MFKELQKIQKNRKLGLYLVFQDIEIQIQDFKLSREEQQQMSYYANLSELSISNSLRQRRRADSNANNTSNQRRRSPSPRILIVLCSAICLL